ncbi:hypothetical protein FJZ53_00855 [Candidatus Woesearchaeota archaeon]|nr:hypothetical protein [Candidatus Woesearchaeota archaeon]
MKRGVVALLIGIAVIILVSSLVSSQQEELSVRFQSFGKNATINLKQYLGPSAYYHASKTTNIIVKIDQQKGTAYLTAKEGWEGSEVVFFKTNESLALVRPEEKQKYIPIDPNKVQYKTYEEIKDKEEQVNRVFQTALDPSLVEIVKQVQKEKIEKITKEVKGNTVRVVINDQVDLKMKSGYNPALSIDFTLGTQSLASTPPPKESLLSKIRQNWWFILFGLVVIAYWYFKNIVKMPTIQKKYAGGYSKNEDLKWASLDRLEEIKERSESNISLEELVSVVTDFFSNYLGYCPDIESVAMKVKNSDFDRGTKNQILKILDDISKLMYYSGKDWTSVQEESRMRKKGFKSLISRLESVIRRF